MITKTDLYLLLLELSDSGIDTEQYERKLVSTTDVPLDVISFINSNRTFDLVSFYEHVRYNYNKKKSKLYKNIVTSDETDDPKEVLTTLSLLLTQILLYLRNTQDSQMFLKHLRLQDITKVLQNYFVSYDLTSCVKLLHIIKLDLKTCEYINKKEI